MELLLELALTISLSLILTFLFVKLVPMHPINIDDKFNFAAEAVKIDRFQLTPRQGEVIKLEERQSEGKSLVRLSKMEENIGNKFEDLMVVESQEIESKSTGDVIESTASRLFEELIKNEGEKKVCTEIEIESAEEEEGETIGCDSEGENVDISDWEEVDFEELGGKMAKSELLN